MDPERSPAEWLARTPLLAGVPTTELAAVAAQLRPVHYAAGQLIFARGDGGRDLLLVTGGRVRISVLSAEGRELSLTHIAAGDLLGEMAALDGGPRSADATAIGPVTALSLPHAALRRAIETSPAVAHAVIAFLCRRVRDTNDKLEAIALHPIEVRLARFFLAALALRGPVPSAGKVPLDIAMSQGELALLVGATRPKVNIALTALEAEGAVVKEGTTFVCLLPRLREVAGTAS
jgi:CRP-like cAMP-binding protein